jgi:Flp pilus assembly protein TadG
MRARRSPGLRNIGRDARGASAVEFALIAPVLILLYFGIAEYCQALMAERKASHVAATVGDLVAQNDTLTASQLTDIFNISSMVLAPFPAAKLKMCVANVTMGSNNVAKATWGQAYNGGACYAANATVPLPKNAADSTKPFVNAGESVIYSQAQYTYTSPVKYLLKQDITFTETFYLRPRKSDSVTCC